MKTKNKSFLVLLIVAVYCIILTCCMCLVTRQTAYASAQTESINYCDDLTYDETGTHTSDTYEVHYDSVTVTNKVLYSAPSYGLGNTSYTDCCAPIAGTSVVGYYDRWYTNLIPNYTPGIVLSNGQYKYYPEYGADAVTDALINMYTLMKTNQDGRGTNDVDFKNGLRTYVNNAGWNYSTASIYKNKTTVDLNKLATAVDENKVALIMCQEYNFVSHISFFEDEKYAYIVKRNSTVGHIMMAYGYKVIEYYRSGSNFRTDYFLCVSSSYSDGEQGYMQLNDFASIDDAFIVSIN